MNDYAHLAAALSSKPAAVPDGQAVVLLTVGDVAELVTARHPAGSPLRLATRLPTSAARSTTSATSPTNSRAESYDVPPNAQTNAQTKHRKAEIHADQREGQRRSVRGRRLRR